MYKILSRGKPPREEHDCELPGKKEAKLFYPGAEIECLVCGDKWFLSAMYPKNVWVRDFPISLKEEV